MKKIILVICIILVLGTILGYFVPNQYKLEVLLPLFDKFENILDENDYISVILNHIDYMLKIRGCKSPYGYAAYSISQLKEPLSNMRFRLRDIKGVGCVIEKIILEILETGSSSYYEKLLLG